MYIFISNPSNFQKSDFMSYVLYQGVQMRFLFMSV